MPIGDLHGVLPPHIAHEAIRLFHEILGQLHAVAANRNGVLFALAASPQLADKLAAFGAAIEDDEDDGAAELSGRLAPSARAAILVPAPLQGGPVPEWSPPDLTLPAQASASVARHWPGLVRPAAGAA